MDPDPGSARVLLLRQPVHLRRDAPPEDGQSWLKYGEKRLACPVRFRGYYRCYMFRRGCPAKKTVDFSVASNPATKPVTHYIECHNHSLEGVPRTDCGAHGDCLPTQKQLGAKTEQLGAKTEQLGARACNNLESISDSELGTNKAVASTAPAEAVILQSREHLHSLLHSSVPSELPRPVVAGCHPHQAQGQHQALCSGPCNMPPLESVPLLPWEASEGGCSSNAMAAPPAPPGHTTPSSANSLDCNVARATCFTEGQAPQAARPGSCGAAGGSSARGADSAPPLPCPGESGLLEEIRGNPEGSLLGLWRSALLDTEAPAAAREAVALLLLAALMSSSSSSPSSPSSCAEAPVALAADSGGELCGEAVPMSCPLGDSSAKQECHHDGLARKRKRARPSLQTEGVGVGRVRSRPAAHKSQAEDGWGVLPGVGSQAPGAASSLDACTLGFSSEEGFHHTKTDCPGKSFSKYQELLEAVAPFLS